jgi:hypothetical protein
MVYGHCHSQREKQLDALFPERRSIDIGIDNAVKYYGAPVPFAEEFFTYGLMSRKGHDQIPGTEGWEWK